MLINIMTRNEIDVCTIKKYSIFFLAAFIVFVLATNSIVFAAGKVKAYGMLTSIEDDGSVIIDEKGYGLSPSATVQNYRGYHILLSDLLPSSYVHFEYEQTSSGFVIVFIKEIPQ